MKSILVTIALLYAVLARLPGQPVAGAWRLAVTDGAEVIKIFASGYFMCGARDAGGKFLYAYGGSYQATPNQLTETYDFYTADSTRTGTSQTYRVRFAGNRIEILTHTGAVAEAWERADEGKTELTGAWRFGARVDDAGKAGERRSADSPRQTVKVLSGRYFQWAAFNRQTRQFMGTGGGTYTLENGKYTENIRFFSRDNSRAGLSLTFDCRIDGNDWYHKGKGTTGNVVSEVWERMR
ncbi:MAG: hypothetical protein KatS3mg032_0324 [Cyclobacteriaceae bacterium]|nr:MAG: hypothetical protein KatS3mg032_0324 [Cyclobacteriaceae bacterium]